MQVNIIRQTEVDFDSRLEQQRASLKTENNTLRNWKKEAEKVAQQIAERDGERSGPEACIYCSPPPSMAANLLASSSAGPSDESSCPWAAWLNFSSTAALLVLKFGKHLI